VDLGQGLIAVVLRVVVHAEVVEVILKAVDSEVAAAIEDRISSL
jgi:hypothetical protein